MKDIEQFFCESINKFMKKHKDEIVWDHVYSSNFKTKKEFFERIKTDLQDAAWCLCELLNWGMTSQDMDTQFIYATEIVSDGNLEYDEEIYMMMDNKTPRYFKIYLDHDNDINIYNYRIAEVEKRKKVIEIEAWEEI